MDLEQSITRALGRIRAFAGVVPCKKLAKEAGVADHTIREARKDDWNPRVDTLLKVASAVPEEFREGQIRSIGDAE